VFTTVNELRKEMMKSKSSDKMKASVLNMLLAEVLKIAKEDGNREANEMDIKTGVKRLIKMAEQSVAQNVQGAQEELNFLNTMAPRMKSVDEVLSILTPIIDKVGMNTGAIMKEIKALKDETIDMKIVSSLIKEMQ
jgi:uncharacterized protein YqeY